LDFLLSRVEGEVSLAKAGPEDLDMARSVDGVDGKE